MLLIHLIRQYYSQLTAGDTFVVVMCITEQSSTLVLTAMLLFSTSTGETAMNYHDCSHRRTPVEFGDRLTFHLVPPAGQNYHLCSKVSYVEKVDCHIKHLRYGLSDKLVYMFMVFVDFVDPRCFKSQSHQVKMHIRTLWIICISPVLYEQSYSHPNSC